MEENFGCNRRAMGNLGEALDRQEQNQTGRARHWSSGMADGDDEEVYEDLLICAPALRRREEVPSLESLALKALAHAVHEHEPTQLSVLPYGGGAALLRQLVASEDFGARTRTVGCHRRLLPSLALFPRCMSMSMSKRATCTHIFTRMMAVPACLPACRLPSFAANRLRPETLQPLLSDWSLHETLHHSLGFSTAQAPGHDSARLLASASGCRGLSALMAQRLSFQHRREASGVASSQQARQLPSGTRRNDRAASAAR